MRLLKEYPAIAAIIGIVILILFSIVIILRGIRTPPDIRVFDAPDIGEVNGRAYHNRVNASEMTIPWWDGPVRTSAWWHSGCTHPRR